MMIGTIEEGIIITGTIIAGTTTTEIEDVPGQDHNHLEVQEEDTEVLAMNLLIITDTGSREVDQFRILEITMELNFDMMITHISIKLTDMEGEAIITMQTMRDQDIEVVLITEDHRASNKIN